MKKFYFRLETPLRIKQLKEKMEKQRLAEAVIKRNKEEKHLVQLELSKKKAREGIEKKLSDSVETRLLSDYSIYVSHMTSQIDAQKIAVKQAHDIYEKRRLSYLAHRREKQIFEKIKEKKYIDYNKRVNNEEQKISDEVANINYSRLERNTPDEEYF
ncbi:MAG: flagellar export protein FliJ [Tepidanaerobacter acetatoxydans]|uniref:flagellar export protein FliJ n=1 Tax=Tepidanaerobacter acetatoxydans TaxID=499229 RepID=UPI0026E957F5|nr:flagellar export protein FliJ [Tepidanaerobacter acetatoxydans]NLU10935.1 flagellar export protein FliJ [Tepidanaerobacter acetatoxydans]